MVGKRLVVTGITLTPVVRCRPDGYSLEIPGYYLKSSGAMALDEWVDGGKYYVDANGSLHSREKAGIHRNTGNKAKRQNREQIIRKI